MSSPGLRLHEIRIEGFKGFTGPQTLTLGGKHLFVLGPNGYGKSSIIEAIRWGLFGSAARQGEVVANQSYSGPCRIEAKLVSAGIPLVLKRALIRGASGGSDASIVDKEGKEHSLREVLPQLESVPAGEGMHIVYSAQTVPLRRAVENLDPFERTLFSYLGLSDVPLMLEHLKEFIENHQEVEARIGREITDARAKLENSLKEQGEEVSRILLNPPWGQLTVPTQSDTSVRIGDFAQELVVLMPGMGPPVLSQEIGGRLREAEQLLGQLIARKSNEFDQAKNAMAQRKRAAEQLGLRVDAATSARQVIDNQTSSTTDARSRALAGDMEEALVSKLETIRKAATESALQHEVRTKSLEWIKSRPDSAPDIPCPVCARASPRKALVQQLQLEVERASVADKTRLADLEAVKKRHDAVLEADARLRGLNSERSLSDADLTGLQSEAEALIGSPQSAKNYREALAKYGKEQKAALVTAERQGVDAAAANAERQRRLELLKDEVRYHRTQDQVRRLKEKLQQVGKAEAGLRDLSLFGNSVRRIHAALNDSLVDQLKSSTPLINERLSLAFNALTGHPVFDVVKIHESSLPRLKLRVASSSDPLNLQHPDQVLNGQAVSALSLVPYFAFAELAESRIEVLLLMLDDPTQSFDAPHIETLVGKLAELGKRVQLVIATHEVEKFDEFVSRSFPREEYSIVRVQTFDKQMGPGLVHASG